MIELFYFILGFPTENPSHVKNPTNIPYHVKNPSLSNGMGSTPPIVIPSHGMGPVGRVHGMGYPIFFRPLMATARLRREGMA